MVRLTRSRKRYWAPTAGSVQFGLPWHSGNPGTRRNQRAANLTRCTQLRKVDGQWIALGRIVIVFLVVIQTCHFSNTSRRRARQRARRERQWPKLRGAPGPGMGHRSPRPNYMQPPRLHSGLPGRLAWSFSRSSRKILPKAGSAKAEGPGSSPSPIDSSYV